MSPSTDGLIYAMHIDYTTNHADADDCSPKSCSTEVTAAQHRRVPKFPSSVMTDKIHKDTQGPK